MIEKMFSTETEVCLFLRQEKKGYPPYCMNPDYCKEQKIYGGNKYCGREFEDER